eukprot:m.185168 g.185168  ORF g.185168 m.185168 type:complete len:77 (-) comp10516_c0_seq4:509-739(-)
MQPAAGRCETAQGGASVCTITSGSRDKREGYFAILTVNQGYVVCPKGQPCCQCFAKIEYCLKTWRLELHIEFDDLF